MANRLSNESSPYLLQHAENPVDWLPWGDEAFDRARREGKPVFLSVGYSSCHWCHVMAHESFEDLEVASLLNRSFVNVKVDREERPDVDEAYMTAVQLQSGRGGWPMSAFLTPDKEPFFAGTYFPKAGFLSLLRQVEAAWHGNRDSVLQSANEFAEAIRSATGRPAPMARGNLDVRFLEAALGAIESEFDSEHGGFGGAPKFPPHAVLAFLLKFSQSALFGESSRTRAREMALFTLEKMCCGGIHDHVGGGFHRYSTDAVWLLPHFEKMLYDNALMLDNLAHASGLAKGDQAALFARAQSGIVAWLKREMRTEDGLFGAAIDADSDGEEGKFYVWEAREAREVLGERAEEFLAAYGFAEEGNFLDEATRKRIGTNVPHVRDAGTQGFEVELQLLREARDRRARPLFDHKALVGLNGLAVAALARAGEHELAQETMDRLWAAIRNRAIPHQVTNGRVSGEGFLEDYAGFFFGCSRWKPLDLERLSDLLGIWKAFADPDIGDFFSTTVAHETLFGRSKPVFDQPIPSGNALMARSLVALGSRPTARQIVEANLGWMERAPSSTAGLLLAGLEILEAAG